MSIDRKDRNIYPIRANLPDTAPHMAQMIFAAVLFLLSISLWNRRRLSIHIF
jgi:hypothetical protein